MQAAWANWLLVPTTKSAKVFLGLMPLSRESGGRFSGGGWGDFWVEELVVGESVVVGVAGRGRGGELVGGVMGRDD